MNKKKTLIHIVIPVILTILAYFVSILFIFKIPNGRSGYETITYLFAFKLAFGVLAVSSIISAILYVGSKRK